MCFCFHLLIYFNLFGGVGRERERGGRRKGEREMIVHQYSCTHGCGNREQLLNAHFFFFLEICALDSGCWACTRNEKMTLHTATRHDYDDYHVLLKCDAINSQILGYVSFKN